MKTLPSMKDMRITPAEAEDDYMPTPDNAPAYPYGLCISLCEDELEKLDLTHDDLCVGDMIHVFAMGVVTSKSCSERQDGDHHCRVEIQLTHLAGEDEDDENDEEEDDTPRLYRK